MKIALIKCPIWKTANPPYSLALLKAVLKKRGHEAICFDLSIEFYHCVKETYEKDCWSPDQRASSWYDKDFIPGIIKKYDSFIGNFIERVLATESPIIGFSAYSSSISFALKIAEKIKEKDKKKIIIFGGAECFRHGNQEDWADLLKEPSIDALCLGEGEIPLGNFLEVIQEKGKIEYCRGFAYKDEEGGIIDCGDGEIVEDLDSIPFADFSDLDLQKYRQKQLPIMTSKGCIYRCPFCNDIARMKKFRARTAENVYSEIIYQLKKYPQIDEFFFSDSLLNGNIKVLSDLCDLIIGSGIRIRWGGQATVRKEMTKELLMKLKKAGCNWFGYGVESGSNKVLKLMKRPYTRDVAERVIRDTFEAGITPNFNILIGFPGEGESEFQETLDFVKRYSELSAYVWLNILGMAKDSELEKNGDKWGIQYSGGRWCAIDGTNTHEERLRRQAILKNILKEKSQISPISKK